jgi:hypothetical protein
MARLWLQDNKIKTISKSQLTFLTPHKGSSGEFICSSLEQLTSFSNISTIMKSRLRHLFSGFYN